MPRRNRRDIFDPNRIGVYHCTQRCVRRAFLCGRDARTGKSFDHRRGWIQDRLKELVGGFAFDVLAYCVMENHVHVVIRNRPDILEQWNDEKVVANWRKFYPGTEKSQSKKEGSEESPIEPPMPTKEECAKFRQRLGSISWFMRSLSEPIARRANQEDDSTGHFWEGRFKSQILADETAILACCVYVDLNPIRARLALTPEESLYTSLRARLLRHYAGEGYTLVTGVDTFDDWLAPVEIDERAEKYQSSMPSSSNSRPSDKGFLSMSLKGYAELVDWTGRQLRLDGKSGCIPDSLDPILVRLRIEEPNWCELVSRYREIFKQVAGTPESLLKEARRLGRRWLQTSKSPLG